MNVQKNQSFNFSTSIGRNDIIPFSDIILKYLRRWPYFIIGVVVAMICAFFYLQVTPPTYEIRATLLINDKKSPENRSVLEELDVSNSPNIVENELAILKSRNLMASVVQDLQLWSEYNERIGWKSHKLYSDSPVKFNLLSPGGILEKQEIEIRIKDGNSFYLENADGEENEILFEESINSSFGTWKLEAQPSIEEYKGAKITIVLNNPDDVIKGFGESLNVFLDSKLGAFVHLTLDDRVPQRGKDVLDYLIKIYNEAALKEKNKLTQSTLEFIDNRLASLSGELHRMEMEIEGFRSNQGLTDIPSQSQVYLENVQSNDFKLNEIDVQLSIIEGIEQNLLSPEDSPLIPATLGISDPALNSLVEKLSQLHLQKEKVLASTPESNPVFLPINKQIQSTKNSIAESISGIKSSLLNTKKELESFNSRFESSIKHLPKQEREFVGIKREQAIKEDLYVYLLKKREEVSLSYASTLTDARIIDAAFAGPVKHPKSMFIYALALVLGFAVPAVIIYGKDSFNNFIVSRDEIEEAVGVPVIAELIYAKDHSPLVIQNNDHTAIGEQIRSLRTKLHLVHGHKGKGRVTLLTSSVVSEGKSFVSTNLGLALAASGRRTIILDMDLRKPKIGKVFNLPENHPGLSSFIKEDLIKEEIIQASGSLPNLDIITCGKIFPNPSELLESEKLDALIIDIKESYDDIIIDSPPLHLVTDAMVISRFADVTVYLIRQGFTGRPELAFIDEVNKQQALPKINIILNGIQAKKYGYGYRYDSSYYTA